MEEMVLDLGADEVEVRDQAEKEITQEGDRILPLLRLAIENEDPEINQRAKKLLFLVSSGLDDHSDPKLIQALMDLSQLKKQEAKNSFIESWLSALDQQKDLTVSELLPMLRAFSGCQIDNYYLQKQHFQLSAKAIQEGSIDLLLKLNSPSFASIIPNAPYSFSVLSQHFIENKPEFLKGLDSEKRAWYAVGARDEAFINQLAEDHPAKMYYQINTGQDAGFDAQASLLRLRSAEINGKLDSVALSVLACLKERREGGIKQSEQKAIEIVEKMRQELTKPNNQGGTGRPSFFYHILGVNDETSLKQLFDHPDLYQSAAFHPELCGAGVDLSSEQLLQRGKTLGTELAGILGTALFKTQRTLLHSKIHDLIAVLRSVEARVGVSGIKQLGDHLAQELLKVEKKEEKKLLDGNVMLTSSHIYMSLSRILVTLQKTNMMIQLLDSYFIFGGENAQVYTDEFAINMVGLGGLFNHSLDWASVISKLAPEANKWEHYYLLFNLLGMTYDTQKNKETFRRFEALVSQEPMNEALARVVAFIAAGKIWSTGDYQACLPLMEKANAWEYLGGICSNYPLYFFGASLTEHYAITKDPESLKKAETLFGVAQGIKETNKLCLYFFQTKLLEVQGKLEESEKARKMMDGYEVLGRSTQFGLDPLYAFLRDSDKVIYDNASLVRKIPSVSQLMEKGEYQKVQKEIDSTFLNLIGAQTNRGMLFFCLDDLRLCSDVAQAMQWHREGKTVDALAQLEKLFQRAKKMPKNLPYSFLQFVCREKGLPQNQVKAWCAETKTLLNEQVRLYPHDIFIRVTPAVFSVATGEEIEEGRRILLDELKRGHTYYTTLQLTGLLAHLEEKAGNLELAAKYMKEYALMQPINSNKENYFRIVNLLQKEKK